MTMCCCAPMMWWGRFFGWLKSVQERPLPSPPLLRRGGSSARFAVGLAPGTIATLHCFTGEGVVRASLLALRPGQSPLSIALQEREQGALRCDHHGGDAPCLVLPPLQAGEGWGGVALASIPPVKQVPHAMPQLQSAAFEVGLDAPGGLFGV